MPNVQRKNFVGYRLSLLDKQGGPFYNVFCRLVISNAADFLLKRKLAYTNKLAEKKKGVFS